MAGHVSANETGVPAAVAGGDAGGLGQAGELAVVEEQAVGIEPADVAAAVQLLPLVERAAGEQPGAAEVTDAAERTTARATARRVGRVIGVAVYPADGRAGRRILTGRPS